MDSPHKYYCWDNQRPEQQSVDHQCCSIFMAMPSSYFILKVEKDTTT